MEGFGEGAVDVSGGGRGAEEGDIPERKRKHTSEEEESIVTKATDGKLLECNGNACGTTM